jgi:ribosome biogenesis GTPase
MKLETFGWNEYFEAFFAQYRDQGYAAGRISIQHKERYVIYTEQGELWGQISGKFRFDSSGLHDYPTTGDWVVYEKTIQDQPAIIHHVLERKSKFSRKVAGNRQDEQIIAANIDIAFIVMGLDGNYNPRRLERYLTFAWDSGAHPVIVLNKSDICPILEECIEETRSIARGVDIIVMSAFHPEDLAPFHMLLKPGVTGVLLGSSGVGKSTITNLLLGKEHSYVQEVRESDSRGRHTTAYRELVVLPTGGIIIDTPGLRELQFWESEEGLSGSFDDIEELSAKCRFRDCKHEAEPDCAVKNALEDGTLDADRYENYQKLQREIRYQAARLDMNAQKLEKERWKKISKLGSNKLRNKDKQ